MSVAVSMTSSSRLTLVIALCLATVEAATVLRTITCSYYHAPNGSDPSILDCSREVPSDRYKSGDYRVSRKILIPISRADWDGRPVWSLSPPLQGSESINTMPSDAFEGLDGGLLNWTDALSLRRLRQEWTGMLTLDALDRLESLTHLELAETDVTCLRRNFFNQRLAARLISLRLTDNGELGCIQQGALDSLTHLAELTIHGSPQLKSLGGVPTLPSLIKLELLSGTSATTGSVQAIPNSTFCRVSDSLRHLTLDSELALHQQAANLLLPSLYKLRSLQIHPPAGEAPEATVQRLIAQLQAALCVVWPQGDLSLNGAPLMNWVMEQLSMDYVEFCRTSNEVITEYEIQAGQICGKISDIAVNETEKGKKIYDYSDDLCGDACPVPTMPPTATPATSSQNPTQHLEKPIISSISSGSGDNNARAPQAEDATNWERQGIIGTVLLTSGAFIGGALIAAYCCHSRRRMAAAARLKLANGGLGVIGRRCSSVPLTGAITMNAAGTVGPSVPNGCNAPDGGEKGESIRLIGYTGALDGGVRVVMLKESGEASATKELAKVEKETEEGAGALLTAEL